MEQCRGSSDIPDSDTLFYVVEYVRGYPQCSNSNCNLKQALVVSRDNDSILFRSGIKIYLKGSKMLTLVNRIDVRLHEYELILRKTTFEWTCYEGLQSLTTHTYIAVRVHINILTCGDEALLFNSSRTRKVAATSDPTFSIFTVLDSWCEDKNGSDTTTTGLLALSVSPICACDNNCRWRGAGGLVESCHEHKVFRNVNGKINII